MTSVATFALVLFILGVAGLFVQAFGIPLGRVSPGWLGAALIGVGVLLVWTP